MWRVDAFQILLAIALDLLLGDPRGWPHIARLAGGLSTAYEKLLTARLRRSVFLGAVFWALVSGTMLMFYIVLLRACAALGPRAAWILQALVIYQAIAATDLARHVRAVVGPLAGGNLAAARARLAWIVGRDTDQLDESGISRAAIESVAESMTDAVIAPLFWSLVAGAPGALIYRTANTLDSTVGHRTEAYEKFGKVSARIDDVLNWLPSRICAAAFCVFSSAVRWKTVRREAAAHASPNAGWSEAAMAYALGVQLGGENFYGGQCVCGPVFNASSRAAAAADIATSLVWMWRVAGVCAAGFILLSFCLGSLLYNTERPTSNAQLPIGQTESSSKFEVRSWKFGVFQQAFSLSMTHSDLKLPVSAVNDPARYAALGKTNPEGYWKVAGGNTPGFCIKKPAPRQGCGTPWLPAPPTGVRFIFLAGFRGCSLRSTPGYFPQALQAGERIFFNV